MTQCIELRSCGHVAVAPILCLMDTQCLLLLLFILSSFCLGWLAPSVLLRKLHVLKSQTMTCVPLPSHLKELDTKI